jgi:hypothetical protein
VFLRDRTCLSPSELAKRYKDRYALPAVPSKSVPLTEVSPFAKSQYGDAFHVSWLQQIATCAHILARLHFRNKQNYVG